MLFETLITSPSHNGEQIHALHADLKNEFHVWSDVHSHQYFLDQPLRKANMQNIDAHAKYLHRPCVKHVKSFYL